jgi:hypothetical protein
MSKKDQFFFFRAFKLRDANSYKHAMSMALCNKTKTKTNRGTKHKQNKNGNHECALSIPWMEMSSKKGLQDTIIHIIIGCAV